MIELLTIGMSGVPSHDLLLEGVFEPVALPSFYPDVSFGAITVVDGILYIGYWNSFISYNPASGEWKQLADNPNGGMRSGLTVAHGGYIYVISGQVSPANTTATELVSRYHIETNGWETFGTYTSLRRSGAVGVWGNAIYVYAGITGSSSAGQSNKLLKLDLSTRELTEVGTYGTVRHGLAFEQVGQYLYVFGGESQRWNTLDRLDLETLTWKRLSNAPVGRSYSGLGARGRYLYLAGGWTGAASTRDFIAYDTVED